MDNQLNIITLSTTNYIHTSLMAVCDNIKRKHKNINVYNINWDKWYPGHLRQEQHFTQIQEYSIPRPSGKKSNFWNTANIEHELSTFYPDFILFIENIFDKLKPNLVITATDQGHFEKHFLLYANKHHIPAFYWVHGLNTSNIQNSRNWLKENFATYQEENRSNKYLFPPIFPDGFNADCYLCTNNARDTGCLIDSGILSHQIIETGCISYDDLLKKWHLLRTMDTTNKLPLKKKIIFLSSGEAIFNMTQNATLFYKNVYLVMEKLNKLEYDIFLRLKPGESEQSLPEYIRTALQRGHLTLSDNSIPWQLDVQNYNIAVGSVSSALVEAILSRVAVVRLSIFSDDTSSLDYFRLLRLEDINDTEAVMACAGSKEYLTFQDEEILRLEKDIFHSLDGRAASRVADAALEALSSSFTPSKHMAHPDRFLPEVIFHPLRKISFLPSPAKKDNPLTPKRRGFTVFKNILPNKIITWLQAKR